MTIRVTQETLQKLKSNVVNVYSFSKLSCIEQCPYQAYLNYIEKRKTRKTNIWGVLGGKLHEKLEDIVNKKAEVDELQPLIKEELKIVDMLGIDFPKDFKGGDTIRENWVANIEHFCNTFVPLAGSFNTEEFFLLPLDEKHFLQGYIDLIRQNDDGTISIMDWKTSALYKGETLTHALHQLIIYAIAMEHRGLTVRDVSWVFMKYATLKYYGYKTKRSKDKSLIEKVVERRNIAKELEYQIRCDMIERGYNDLEIDIYIQQAIVANDISLLPPNIAELYDIQQYILTVDYNREHKLKTLEYVWSMIDEFECRDKNNAEAWESRQFIKTNSKGNVVEDTFYCNCLCDFGESCEYISNYTQNKTFNDTDYDSLFS